MRNGLDYRQFCSLMRTLRERLPAAERSLDAVAARAGLKRGQLYGFETIHARQRLVARSVIDALAVVYRASEEERRSLLQAAGHTYIPPTLRDQAQAPIDDLLAAGEFAESDRVEFVADLGDFVARWRSLRRTRLAQPRKAVVAAAGWQTQLFREDRFQRALLPTVHEAFRAGMHEVFIVVPPTMTKLALVERTFPGKRIRLVQQERALGLANVVLLVKPYVGEEPFALLLPDDVDPEMRCLQHMLALYARVRRPIIAVEPIAAEQPAVSRNFGIAPLATTPVLSESDRLFYLAGELREKPSDAAFDERTHKIVGRYVFTPDLFAALTDLHLTAAINRAWGKANGMCAYVVEHPLASIARLKEIIASMDDQQIFSPSFYR